MSGTHVNVPASVAHTSSVHDAPQRSHGDVPDWPGRLAKDRTTGSHWGGHATASPIAREDASSMAGAVLRKTPNQTRVFSEPAYLLQQVLQAIFICGTRLLAE